MIRLPILLSLLVIVAAQTSAGQTSAQLIGTWELVARSERDATGQIVPDSSLGADPVGLLIYDATGHVAVQLMKRRRSEVPCRVTAKAAANNLAHVGGYDAYFGRYEVNPATHTVTHHLEGALGPADVGRALTREYQLKGDTLTLQFRPGGPGDTHMRTLVWHRVSS